MIGKFVHKPQVGRRFAVGDIHGCFETLRTLVEEKIQLNQQDQLFLLGDYVNRGPKPTKVIDFILRLQQEHYQVYPLRGNHEQMLLNEKGTYLVEPYKGFFTSLLLCYETQDFFLVHAGLNFLAENPLEETYSMLWMRESPLPDEEFLGGKKVVFGHTIHSLAQITKAIQQRAILLPLDNGCYKGLQQEVGAYGNLCALNMDTYELILQPNIDKK